jgi:hypothetical protein
LAHGNGIFLAVAYDGTVGTSADGAQWQFHKVDVLGGHVLVAYAAGTFVAVDGSTNLFTSPDGTNWVRQRFPDIFDVSKGLSSAGGAFWLCTYSRVDEARKLYTSTTGTNWIRSTVDFFSLSASGVYNSVVFGGGVYVCVGGDTSAPLWGDAPTIVISADRTNWITEWTGVDPWDAADKDGTSLKCVTYGDNLFVAVGNDNHLYNGGTAGRNIWYSSDGTNWTYELTTFPDLWSVTYGDGVYAAVGGYQDGAILTSTDGKQWTAAQIDSTNRLNGIVYGQNTFVTVGNYGQIYQSDPVVTLKTSGQPGQFLIRAPAGRTCTIEAADSLGETNTWQSVGGVTINTNPMTWTDPWATNGLNRFYRVRLEP